MQRYKLSNISLVGIIPGPWEPDLTLNSYIDQLVSDLLEFWNGVELNVNVGSHTQQRKVRCAIICCSCDLPAGRKLCGFLSYNARLGYSKCKKEFSSTVFGNQDFSGFNRGAWTPRTNAIHRTESESLLLCTSKSHLRNKVSLGVVTHTF